MWLFVVSTPDVEALDSLSKSITAPSANDHDWSNSLGFPQVFLCPLVMKHGWLENPLGVEVSTWENWLFLWSISSTPCLTPEGTRGQAEEKRAEAEMEELEKHRVAWPEIWREMGVSKVMRVPFGEHTKNYGKIQHVEWVNQVFLF